MKEETNSGWVKLHRSILRWEWWDDANTARVFIYCLLKANPVQKKWHGITIERGTFITSYPTIAKETGLTLQQIRTAIKRLKSTREITYQTTHDFSIVTITNYERYQQQPNPEEHPEQQPNQQSSNTPATGQQQASNNNEEYKEEKEIKNNLIEEEDAHAQIFEEKSIFELYENLKETYETETETANAIRLKIHRDYGKQITTAQIAEYHKQFVEKTIAEGTTKMTRKNYQHNFAYWLYKRVEAQQRKSELKQRLGKPALNPRLEVTKGSNKGMTRDF